MLFAVSAVCASFCRRALEEHSPGKFVAEFGRGLYIYVRAPCLGCETTLASVYPSPHRDRTPVSRRCSAVVAVCAALDSPSDAEANPPKLCGRFHAGVCGHFTCHLPIFSPPFLAWGRIRSHLLCPRRVRVLSKALQTPLEIRASGEPFCCLENGLSYGANQGWGS